MGNLSLNPSKSVVKKLIHFADLYRGSDDTNVRGNSTRCYQVIHPKSNSNTARAKAAEYLNHPITQRRLQSKAEELGAKMDITQERVLQEIGRLGLYDIRRLIGDDGRPLPISQLDDETAAAIVGIEVVTIGNRDAGIGEVVKYKLADKNAALEKLMKYFGAYEKDNKQKGLLADLPREVVQLIASKLRNES